LEAGCEPKPAQQLRPVCAGGSGEQHTLRVVARHADGRKGAGILLCDNRISG